VGMLGRSVVALGDQVTVGEGGDGTVSVEIGGSGGRATLRVFDESGNEVGSRVVGTLGGGRQNVALGAAAEGLAPGRYTYAVEVVDGAGRPVTTQTLVTGRVDGVRYTSLGPLLTAGSLRIPFGSVLEVGSGG
jgi:flagellar hook assembly protein FlgD